MKNFKFTINGIDFETEILSIEGNKATIEINGTPYTVTLDQEVKQSKTPTLVRSEVKEPQKKIEKRISGRALIKSPLPGTILKIMVKQGDSVVKNQVLYSLEAMKMENEIKSDREGIVTAVRVSPGQSVLQDELILEME